MFYTDRAPNIRNELTSQLYSGGNPHMIMSNIKFVFYLSLFQINECADVRAYL